MLKPKREILRKEIKKDPFLEGVFSAKTHFETNKQRYYKIVGSVADLGKVRSGVGGLWRDDQLVRDIVCDVCRQHRAPHLRGGQVAVG